MSDKNKDFDVASSLIKVVALLFALLIAVASRYAFIFFAAAMLPTIFILFLDKTPRKYLSATLCSFNLIGVVPYLVRIWNSESADHYIKLLLADVSVWTVIYGAAFVGMATYVAMPLAVVKIYEIKAKIELKKIEARYKEIAEEWGVDTKQEIEHHQE